MGTLNEDLSAIKEVEDKIIANKVARFAYTDKAYTTNDAHGVAEYNVNKEQNIPTADASVLKVNETVLSRGYRAQASSVTRMLLNHFFGRMSYNLNKVNDIVSNLIATLIGHRGTANGFATLDENGRIPYSQLPESAMEYKGQWNAKANTPTLADGTGTKGDFYIVSVGGTQNLGSGDIQFSANDRIIYDGSVWARLSAGAVQTVNNISPENGNVTLTGENIPVSATNATLLSAPLTTDRYADSSVTTEKIADNAVTNAKIADNAVTNAKIKDPVSVAKGGTGATDAKNGFMNLANGLTQSQNPQDTEYMIYKSGTNWGLYTLSTFWEYIKGKTSSVLGLTADAYGGRANTAGTADSAKNMYSQTLDLSALDKTKFYPLVCYSGMNFAEVAIHSPNLSSSDEYNQNRIHFDISTSGWTDLPPTLNIREYACFDNKEITIGCIGRGIQSGWAIWLRGGRTYACFSRNCELSLKTSDYAFGEEVYTVGTNYYGGTNINVREVFTPQSTITEGAYSSRPITAPSIKATTNFIGNLEGNATNATNDANGNNIVNTYALKSDLQYIKSINIMKVDGSSSTQRYLIAKMPGAKNLGNVNSLFVNGSDCMNRMFEGSIKTSEGNYVYNYGKDKLPIALYEQTDGTIYVYWLVNDPYISVVLNIAATSNITIYGGNLSPVTPTGSKMTLTEYDYKSYDHIVHDDASLLEWANCTDGSMKKVLIKSGTYNMTKGVNLSNAGTGYVLAEQGAVIKSHVTTAFEKTTNALCSIYNLEVVCCVSENSSYCTAFKDSYSNHVFNKYLVLYNCKAGYDTVKLCNNYLFLSCWCFNCIFDAVSNTTTGMSVKTFSSCYCINCVCTLSVQGTTLFKESDFFRNCTCINCRGDIEINVDILYSTEAFCAFHYCYCTACDAVFTCAAPTLSVQTPCYCFKGGTRMSSCYAFADYQSTSTRHISGICDCSYISATNSNKWEGLNSKVDADSCNNS